MFTVVSLPCGSISVVKAGHSFATNMTTPVRCNEVQASELQPTSQLYEPILLKVHHSMTLFQCRPNLDAVKSTIACCCLLPWLLS